MLNMDLSHLLKLASMGGIGSAANPAPENNEAGATGNSNASAESKPAENSGGSSSSQNMMASMLPLLLKNSGQESMMPLISMLQGGKMDHEQLLKHLLNNQRSQTTKKPADTKSELDSYTRLEQCTVHNAQRTVADSVIAYVKQF